MHSEDRKREGVGSEIETDLMRFGQRSGWTGDHRIGNLIPFHRWVGNLEVYSGV